MLEIVIPEQHYDDLWDEAKQEFLPSIHVRKTKIQLEHSLISLKKWEQRWHKPFFDRDDKTYEELIDYIRCMTLNHVDDENVYNWMPQELIEKVVSYIKDPMTATWFKEDNLIVAQKCSREIITAEIIYYWMISLNIPVDFQKWHLNQLLTLIKVVSIKNGKPQKKDKRAAAMERMALNKLRREKYNSKG